MRSIASSGNCGCGTLASGRASFQLSVLARGSASDLDVSGNLTYRDLTRKLTVRADDIDVFDVASDGKSVRITGSATVNGVAGYRFEATAEDRSPSGKDDRFRIKITGPGDFSYDSRTGGRSDRVERGNIVLLRTGR